METIYFEDFKKEQKRRKFKEKMIKTKEWFINNKEIAIPLCSALFGSVTYGTKQIIKHRQNKKQKDLKDLYCYDRSLGHYWALKRELTNSEWIEIDKRKRNGERLSDILEEFKVLK